MGGAPGLRLVMGQEDRPATLCREMALLEVALDMGLGGGVVADVGRIGAGMPMAPIESPDAALGTGRIRCGARSCQRPTNVDKNNFGGRV